MYASSIRNYLIMKIKFTTKQSFLLLIIIAFILSLSCAFYANHLINTFNDKNLIDVKEQQANLLNITSNSIDNKFGNIAKRINDYSSQISDGVLKPEKLGTIIYKDEVINDNNVLGAGIVFFDPQHKIKSQRLYWQFQNSGIVNLHNRKSVKPEHKLIEIIKNEPHHWSRPYYDDVLKQYIVSYTSVFYYPNSTQVAGVVVLDMDLDIIINLIARNIGEKFTSIVNNHDKYVYSNDTNRIVARSSLANPSNISNSVDQQIMEYNHKQTCYQVCHNVVKGETNNYVIYKQMINVPWLIFAKYSNDELKSLIRSTPNSAIMLWVGSLASCAICLVLIVLSLMVHRRNFLKVLWTGAASISIICLIGTIYVWNISRNLYFINYSNAITSNVKLQKLLKPYQDETKLKNIGDVLEVPTAVLIDSVEFLNAYNLQLTGTIMQNYPKEYNVTDGIKFNNSFDTKITKVSDISSPFYRTIIWTFQTKIRENFDYKHYPFNHGKIWLSISPFRSGSNLIFTPNFAYYNGLSNISANYGVNPDIIIPGWQIHGSYFSYSSDKSRMVDEIDSYDNVRLPSLVFNVLINSSISDAIITTIIPPIIIILILFVLLLTINKYRNRFIEFKVSGIISSCGGMLFTIVFTHVSLRNKLTSEIMYIEYIYLLMYVIVLLIPVNAFLFASNKYKHINYGNNIFFKLLFIPLLTSLVFIMTLFSFS